MNIVRPTVISANVITHTPKIAQYLVTYNNNIFINCNWVVTRWQLLFYMYTKHEIGY